MKIAPLISLVLLMLSGCAAVQPGADALLVRTEQSEAIGLVTVDAALRFESENREALPVAVRKAAAGVRSHAARAFVSLDDVRLAYKAGTASESKVLVAMAVVEELVSQVIWWTGELNGSPAVRPDVSPTQMLLIEAETYDSESPAAWATAVPLVITLAKEVYTLVLSVKESLGQDRAWTADEAAKFRSKLMTTVVQPHWRK